MLIVLIKTKQIDCCSSLSTFKINRENGDSEVSTSTQLIVLKLIQAVCTAEVC